MRRVLTYGTFDLFHFGHIQLLKRARALGDHLTIGLSTDEFNLGKNKTSVHPFQLRKENLEAIKFVDLVIPEITWEQKVNDIKTHKIDVFVMGDDWTGKFDFLKEYCEVIYLPRTPGISSSMIKEIELKKTNG